MTALMTVQDGESFYTQPPAALTTATVAGPPQQVQVSDSAGLLATLTVGSKTAVVRGQTRTFAENKRPFTDTFSRTVSSTWGLSPGGGQWLNLSGTDANFSVNGSQGVILNDVANTGRYCSLRDDDVADVNATCKLTVNAAPAGASTSVGMTFGYQDSTNHYRCRLLFNTTGTVQLVLERVAGGTTTTIGAATTIGSGFTASQWWHIRVQRTGTTIRCRGWLDGSTEPSAWTFSLTDATYPTGRIGFRSFASTGSTVLPFNTLVDDLTVDTCTWGHPPAVTHSTWVRTLSTPFNGTWTPTLADQVRRWASDTSPDALAYAMMFVTDAPTVTDPSLSGARVFGEAQYGPLNADGTRVEFSDWNDYIGIGWTYPDGEVRSFPHGSVTVSGCLDCSGYVRMVYGRGMSIPLTFDSAFDGLNLPRRSANMGPSGPGTIVVQGTGSPPSAPPASLTAVQPGDLLYFDADTSEPVEGQVDHTGIYLGADGAGAMRFISSRKTVSGPTFGDLGGASTINGSGTYSTRLRMVRRF